MNRWALVLGIFVAWAVPAGAQTAVIETNHHSWYNPSSFGGLTMTQGYAPFAVFFEGWKSTPREDIVEYRWNFGDGSPITYGFNAAHVFDDPGNYTVTLTVENGSGGTASTTTTITVMARDGTTYYVDADAGNNANDGLTPETAWRTATHAFLGMTNQRYGPGDQILFKRGQTFEMLGGVVNIGTNQSGFGYMFGTYGEGPKPVIKYQDTGIKNFITQNGHNLAHVTLMDLVFDCRSATDPNNNYVLLFMDVRAKAHSVLFYRVNWLRPHKTVSLTGDQVQSPISNVFFMDCTSQYSTWVMFYDVGTRIAVVGSHFDFSGNHIWYGSWTDTGVWYNNIFTRPSFGRVGLRLAAASNDFSLPTQNVYVGRNYFGGHVDPVENTAPGSPNDGGTRYNFEITYFAPNVPETQAMQDVVFENNVLTNFEIGMIIGCYENLRVRNNLFLTVDPYAAAYRVKIGHNFDKRPLKDVYIENNDFYSFQNRSGAAGIFHIVPYSGPEYNGRTQYENIVIQNNEFHFLAGTDPVLFTEDTSQALMDQLTMDNNVYHRNSEERWAQIGGYWQGGGGTMHNLTSWRNTYGHDMNSTMVPETVKPFPGQAFSPAIVNSYTFDIDYDSAFDYDGGSVPTVKLWVRASDGVWQETGITGPGPEGTFTFTAPGPGKYHFATSSVNSSGIPSLLPTEYPNNLGPGRTVVQGDAGDGGGGTTEPDTTAPIAGTASSPATASSTPITVTYSGASDPTPGSGLKQVKLWVKIGSGGTWQDSGLLPSTTASGSFSYGVSGNGTYYFAVRAEDNAGNFSPLPTADGDASTVFELTVNEGDLLVSDLRFDDDPADGTATDSSGSNNHGVMSGASTPALDNNGQVGGSYLFDGNDHVSLGNLDVNNTGLSISCFVRATQWGAPEHDARIVAKCTSAAEEGRYWQIQTYNFGTTKLAFHVRSTNGTLYGMIVNTPVVELGQWYHIAAICDSTTMKVYVNGALAATRSFSGSVAQNASIPVWIGDMPTIAGKGWIGNIDEVAIYDYALTDPEIQILASGGHVGTGGGGGEPADTTAPAPGVATAPSFANASPITVSYSGAGDETGGSGLQSVTLWARKDGGAWASTGLTQTTASGTFDYSGMSGDGTYAFALVAEDNAGNVSATPSGSGSTSTIFDTTPPSPGSLSVGQYSSLPITVNFGGASDTSGSGFKRVHLWAKQGTGGTWANTGVTNSSTSGSLIYSGASGDNTYFFALQAEDQAGNLSPAPSGSGQGSTIVDSTAPNAGTLTAATQNDSESPITLNYGSVGDSGSGIKEVVLWAKKGAGGSWASTGLTNTGASGTFNYTGMSGDGTYFFGLRVEDNAGNKSPQPSGAGSASTTYDTGAPNTGTVSVPSENTSTSPVSVSYSGATDSGSGLQEVRLWVQKDSGGWTDTGQTSANSSDTFTYFVSQGDGVYRFALQTTDNLGNSSPTPSGSGQASVTFDTAAPSTGTLTGPDSANAGPVTLNYSGASDSGSGLKLVKLWVKNPASSWIDTGQTATSASGSFDFNSFAGDGSYAFAIQAEDNAGNTSTSPSGAGQFSLTYDATAPVAPSVTAPANSTAGPIEVTYSGASDSGSGLEQVELWVRQGAGTWAATGQTATTASGTFAYSGMSGDDTYYFAVRARDVAGNESAAPSGDGQANTIFDTSAPIAPSVTVPPYSAGVPVDIAYTGETDVVNAYLWMRKGTGAWTDTGIVESGSTGSFHFNAFTDDDTYYWSVQVEDDAGNKSAAPSGDGMANTIFDTTAPTPPSLSVDSPVGGSPLTITYTDASDGGSGVAEVELWVRKDAGVWSASGVVQPAEDGSFSYDGMSGDGTYHFAAQVTDEAGNSSAPPSGAGSTSTIYDTTAPSPGFATAPASASTNPITINFAGVSDTGSGVETVELWVRQGAGAWQSTGQTSPDVSGSFGFTCPGDDTFYFALRATDAVGNQSPEPSGDGDSNTAFDSTPPSGATVTAPAYANTAPVTVSYVGSTDVERAYLWFRKADGGIWTDSGLVSDGSTGSFAFSGFTGDDTYYVDVRTEDAAQNLSPVPTNSGAASVIFDTTAPDLGTISAQEHANTGPITLNYSGVSDNASGVKTVYLWMRKGAGSWTNTGQTQSGAAAAFTFNAFTGDDTYFFALTAEDNAGNVTSDPSGDGLASTIYDTTAPTVGTLTAPESASSSPISLTYSGADDGGTGLSEVRLWVRKGVGAWMESGFTSTEAAGAFDYSSMTGDATYYFALQAEDVAGNVSAVPSGSGLDSTLYDATPPAAATLNLAQYDNSSPIVVPYDAGTVDGSGFKSAKLWVRKGAGGWTDTGQTFTQPNASFSYSGMSGDDTYYFYVQIEDNAGNVSADPSGSGSGNVVYDTTAPAVGSMTSAEYALSAPISVSYSGVSDNGSGLKEVVLWSKKDSGAWGTTTVSSTSGSGTFSFNNLNGDGAYSFGAVAEDNAGNKSAAPSGAGLTTTTFDGTAPDAGTASVPEYADASPVTVTYSGASDAGSGFKEVTLYVRKNSGAWTSTNLKATEPSGSFDYTVTTGDGSYAFALRAKDEAGNESAVPSGQGDDSVVYDTTAPTPPSLSAPEHTSSAPVTVSYTGANDTGSGIEQVELWMKKDAGAWAATGQAESGSSGSFIFNGFTGEGTYSFATVVTDNAGKSSPDPSGNGAASVVFDTTAPSTGSVSAPANDNSPPISITYSGVSDSGSGVDSVQLWVRKGAGVWADSGLSSIGESGAFSYEGMTDDDTYFFALRAEDNAGNLSAAPSGDGQASTVYDTSFTPGTASSPEYATDSPIVVTYDGAAQNDPNASLTIILWYKKGDDGIWTETALTSTGSSGQFIFNLADGDARYYFGLQAENTEGERTTEPSGNGDTSTLLDTVAPTPLTLDSVEATNVTPIVVNYEGVTDEGSGVKEVHLWVKRGIDGIWEDTGLFLSSAEGAFEYDTGGEENRYFFYVQAMDHAGLTSPPPTDDIVFGTPAD